MASTPLIVANYEIKLLILINGLEICVVLNNFDDLVEVVPVMLAANSCQFV
jgi:hypothetical protein